MPPRALLPLAFAAASLASLAAANVGGPRADDAPAMASWIAERVTAARAGVRERVEVPLVEVAEGWGCPCPTHYLGAAPDTHGGEATWVAVELAPGVRLPAPARERLGPITRSRGAVSRVEGHFTGEVRERDMGLGYEYRLPVLYVTRVRGALRGRARGRFRAALLP